MLQHIIENGCFIDSRDPVVLQVIAACDHCAQVIQSLRSSHPITMQVIQQKTGSLSYFSDMGFFILMKLYCLEYIFGNEIGCFEFATECTVMFAQ